MKKLYKKSSRNPYWGEEDDDDENNGFTTAKKRNQRVRRVNNDSFFDATIPIRFDRTDATQLPYGLESTKNLRLEFFPVPKRGFVRVRRTEL